MILAADPDLGVIWGRHLARAGMAVSVATDQAEAIAALCNIAIDIIVIDMVLCDGSAMAVADFANYRRPEARVIFVSNSRFFSDGSIFQHMSNACAVIPAKVTPEDLEAVVSYHGTA